MQQLAPIYIIAGDETLLVQEARDNIRTTALKQGFENHELLQASSGFDWSQLQQAAQSGSLFGDKTLIEVRLPTGKPGKTGGKALADYSKNIPSDKLLLIIAPKLDKATQNTAWFKALSQQGQYLPQWPIDRPKLPQWAQQRAKSLNLQLDPQAAQLLCDLTEGNLLATAQELEKLRLTHGEKKLGAEELIESLGDSARFSIFQLTDTALSGDANKTVRILQRLREEATEPTLVLWTLSKELRTLAHLHNAQKQRLNLSSVMKQQGVFSKRVPIVQSALKRLSEEWINQSLSLAAQIDQTIKGQQTGNVWDLLRTLALRLTGQSLPC